MTVYHVKTQADYDALMIELEEKGCEWRWGEKPTTLDKFKDYGKDTYIYEEYGGIISFSDGYYFKVYRSNETLIEYKAKGESMTQEEMKHNLQEVAKLHEVAFDISASIESFARGTLAVEKDLQEAKSSAKKLIEKIDEYLENLKPKFKVGDYVVEQNGDVISKINEVMNGRFFGSYYKRFDNYFYSDNCSIFPNNIERYATPKEIAEYEVALTFHKRGRKPFEVKEGDIISDSEAEKIFVDASCFWDKEDFTGGDCTLLKTVEEVNEWLENK